ncbi:MAG: hypothetical protein ACO1OX_05400 [Novosphingobium sp.]
MTKINAISPRNTMAISAMLMLSVGSAYAQDATVPVIDAPVAASPVVTPAPAPVTPTIVIPTPTAEPVTAPAPPVATETVAPPTAEARQTARPAARATARTVSQAPASDARTAAANAEPADPAPAPVAVADPVPAIAPQTATEATEAAPVPPAVSQNDTSDWALPVGAAATLLVLGGAGIAMRRRRRAYEEDVDFVPPVMARPTMRPQPERRVAPPMPPVAQPSAPTVAMTPAMVRTASEREELIERIVAAEPDEANPFHSRKARRRRARIMVQSMATRNEVPAAPAARATPVAQPDYAQA